MQIPKKQLDKFKLIFKEKLGIELTEEEAKEEAGKILMLYKTIYRPLPKAS